MIKLPTSWKKSEDSLSREIQLWRLGIPKDLLKPSSFHEVNIECAIGEVTASGTITYLLKATTTTSIIKRYELDRSTEYKGLGANFQMEVTSHKATYLRSSRECSSLTLNYVSKCGIYSPISRCPSAQRVGTALVGL